ncbi:hypothetical protein LCGC14_1595190 [marine sediment metagenome]|uniref:Macro domain-containing protein n=1 Tax=marine sediment metagenome TaxID=412755 RepID=A0A0F9KTI6_9ZZZZ|nr:hypothetical protein [Desulfobacterales bacterium]
MLEFVKGDFFDYEADIMVNTVNCVGVMGAGVALAFKRKYPDMFKYYEKQCKRGEVKPGKPSVWSSNDMISKGVEIINFPTKGHWRKPSEYEYVETGLVWLSEYLSERQGLTVTLPALGCGHGGLEWSIVKEMIKDHLGKSENRVLVFEPASSRNVPKNGYLDEKYYDDLLSYNVRTIKNESDEYPISLKEYTDRELFVFPAGGLLNDFDVAIVSSSKPDEEEKKVIGGLIDFCDKRCLSIMFGASAFDKLSASRAAGSGIRAGVFLPTGILNSAQKIIESKSLENPTLFSIGDPKNKFDKKEYMPSVLSRVALSKVVFFTTGRLSWVSKYQKILNAMSRDYYYVNYGWFEVKDFEEIGRINASPIFLKNGVANFTPLKFLKKGESI